MFQLQWANKELWLPDDQPDIHRSTIDRNNISSVLKVVWEEHCVECAIPECYNICSLYKPRKDGACARFVYGIMPDRRFSGHYNYGADVTFRRWGKLEACLLQAEVIQTRSVLNNLINTDMPGKITRKRISPKNELQQLSAGTFDEFVIECYSSAAEDYKLICEYFTEHNRVRDTKFRHVFSVKKGFNVFYLPFEQLNITALDGYIYLYPEESEKEKRLIFTWLDFVKYKKRPQRPVRENITNRDIKIKCVAWDLDNTFWGGTLIEQDNVVAREEAIELVKQLDERGIIQTIVSKNDFDPCWNQLKKMKMDHYFLLPAINWDPKSKNIESIVSKLNIGLDTVAVIDDSPFERDEISSRLPQVRVYTEKEVNSLLGYAEFNVLVSAESKERRNKYDKELQRMEDRQQFAGSYVDFLINCRMEAEAFVPASSLEIDRCFELIQRSNQLNLSTIRYTKEKFEELLADKDALCIGIRCSDKFGDYGIIGFSSITFSGSVPLLENLVLSCRIAQKRVEHMFMKSITGLLHYRNYKELQVKLIKTPKNGPLRKVFEEFPFTVIEASETTELLHIQTDALFHFNQVMKFTLGTSVTDAACLPG
jgi:FkbH-like protein